MSDDPAVLPVAQVDLSEVRGAPVYLSGRQGNEVLPEACRLPDDWREQVEEANQGGVMVQEMKTLSAEILRRWKEQGFTPSKRKPCLHKLGGNKCPNTSRYGGWESIRGDGCMPECMDHTSVWNKNGKMAAIVTQPYQMNEDDLGEIHQLCKETGTWVYVSNRLNWHYPAPDGVLSLMFQKDDVKLHPADR